MPSRYWARAALVGCLLTLFSVKAEAQLCGDADGNGSVTVTDGVQALRAAALLSNTCDIECDVDGNGTVTVTDGVNILREAADLSNIRACRDVATRAGSVIRSTLDLFGPLTKVGAVSATAAGAASPCDNPGGGFQQTAGGLTFDDCVFGEVSFTGTLTVGGGSLGFSNLQIARVGDVLTLQGNLTLDVSGANPVVSGQLDATSTILGSYVITFQQVAVDALGNTLGGALVFDVSDANIDGVAEIQVTLTGTTSLPVVVRFDDETTGNFNYDTTTEVLTPVTAATPTRTPTRTPTPSRTATPTVTAPTPSATPTPTPTATPTATPTPTATASPPPCGGSGPVCSGTCPMGQTCTAFGTAGCFCS